MNETVRITIALAAAVGVGSLLVWKFKKNCLP